MIHVLKRQKNDIDQLSDLFLSVFNESPWNEDWKKEWAYDRLSILFNSYRFYGCLAEMNNKPIAAVLSRLGSYKGELELEIMETFVGGEEQRKGVGAAIPNELKSHSTEDGISCFVLQTDRNTFTKRFYLKYGFTAHEDNLLMSHEF